jgi:beta-1,4-N-acetylglucosaminyltransferase
VSAADPPVDVLLVCSSGGHTLQLLCLRAAWEPYTRLWVTDDAVDTRSLLADEPVEFAFGPTARNVPNACRNGVLAWRVLRRTRPRVVLTAGAALGVPFAWVARLLGIRVVYVESVTRIDKPSLSCRLVAPVADRIYVQWPDLKRVVRGSRYAGTVIAG